MSGRTLSRYQSEITIPGITHSTPHRIVAIQTSWLRPASAHAHAGRRAQSSRAHTDNASGMLKKMIVAVAHT
jgi:hypothetical protein